MAVPRYRSMYLSIVQCAAVLLPYEDNFFSEIIECNWVCVHAPKPPRSRLGGVRPRELTLRLGSLERFSIGAGFVTFMTSVTINALNTITRK